MQLPARLTITTVLFGTILFRAWAQESSHRDRLNSEPSDATLQGASENKATDAGRSQTESALTEDDRLSLIAAALDARVRRHSEPDCSHLVHAIYEQAGFPYAYAPSRDLFAGVGGFQRIKQPEPGDLVVWRGHVGIVIKPSDHIFFSFMRSGPGTDDYQTSYWKSRGRPRFYRYVKNNSCDGCDPLRHDSRQLLRVKKTKK